MSELSTDKALYNLLLLFLALPVVPLAAGWFRFVRSPAGGPVSRVVALVVLVLVTCSQAFLLAGMYDGNVIGPDYSDRRFTAIKINLAAMVLATGLAIAVRRQVGWVGVASAAWVSCSWLYMGAVSSAV